MILGNIVNGISWWFTNNYMISLAINDNFDSQKSKKLNFSGRKAKGHGKLNHSVDCYSSNLLLIALTILQLKTLQKQHQRNLMWYMIYMARGALMSLENDKARVCWYIYILYIIYIYIYIYYIYIYYTYIFLYDN